MTLALWLIAACSGGDSAKASLAPAEEWCGAPGMRYIFLKVLAEAPATDTGATDTGATDTGATDTGATDTGDTATQTDAPLVDRDRPLLLTALADRWILREGEGGDDRWSRATPFATWRIERSDDFKVDEGTVIPERPVLDDKENGARVTEAGPVSVWYGTFEDAITVRVDEGFAIEGEQAFARGFGPIRLTTTRGTWELAGWMRLTESELAAFENADTGGQDTGGQATAAATTSG